MGNWSKIYQTSLGRNLYKLEHLIKEKGGEQEFQNPTKEEMRLLLWAVFQSYKDLSIQFF